MSDDVSRKQPQPESDLPESSRPELEGHVNDAIEADAATAAAANDTFEQAADGLPGTEPPELEPSEEEEHAPEPAGKLERLQKILAQAGIASRRHAEELITEGRVQVNGKIVTELGTKADATRDHIRVDGKLLQGSERHRYYMLNKPRGFVTTVSDPEGRPTIMQFFSKIRERLYPVGRLDYMSEGLLLVTNDGELANKLTRAASGVEKTYLVKVSGQPSEEELDRLREGVGIDRGKPGSGRVQTAPAQIRRFNPGQRGKRSGPRTGDNPWFEVVLIEGRNRELRKMFEEIGHHVEKIRRVGYGPLVLDLEPGKFRELEPEEVENLRKAAEGEFRKPKSREPRRAGAPPRSDRQAAKPHWNQERGAHRPFRGREERPGRGPSRRFDRRSESGPPRQSERGEFRGQSRDQFRPDTRFGQGRPQRPPRREQSDRPYGRPRDDRRGFAGEQSQERGERPKRFGSRPPRREFGARREGAPEQPARPRFERAPQDRSTASRPFRRDRDEQPRPDRSGPGHPSPKHPSSDRPRREAPGGRGRSRDDRPSRPNRPAEKRSERRQGPHSDQRSAQRPAQRSGRPSNQRPSGSRPGGFKSGKSGPRGGKPGSLRSGSGRRPGGKPGGGGRPGGKRRP